MIRRGMWVVLGFVCVGLGGLGIVVPGLPTTIFFIGAAACFTRSSPRLEAWVLGLPGIGPMVRDHRAGLGMPRRAKRGAIGSIVVFAGLAIVLALDTWWSRMSVTVLALVGIGYILWRIPTREEVVGHD